MELPRSSGILLHISSLPSRDAIGDLGKGAYDFVDFLIASSQSFWQILPYHPVGYGYSPYQTYSAFAGNHLFIDLQQLFDLGLLEERELTTYYKKVRGENTSEATPMENAVDYPLVVKEKIPVLKRAYNRYKEQADSADLEYLVDAFEQFCHENSFWLDDYALFMALKTHFNQLPWYQWERKIATREPETMAYYRELLKDTIDFHCFLQFIFFRQWQKLKQYANGNNIKIIGDIPIFVAHDSADTWANPELFRIDKNGALEVVAGVPPDYFSETGQRWGNPLYDWEAMAERKYTWWIQRFELLLNYVDIVRIDHFRGFAAFWEIPAREETAKNGRWVKGPGKAFFDAIENALGDVPVIAENLGIITSDVEALRRAFDFPGMKVLIFMLETGPVETFKSMFQEHQVLYSGTHDNDTLVGWWKKIIAQGGQTVHELTRYWQLSSQLTSQEACWRLIEITCKSHSNLVIFPLQDILGLDNRARMNIPGTIAGNWTWRVKNNELETLIATRLNKLMWETERNYPVERGEKSWQ